MTPDPRPIKVHQRNVEQSKASDPNSSVWVSANAGSGKTSVLVDRVVRILLQGTSPSRILCLTFTRAAAAEMSNRIFELLGLWATLSDADLSAQLKSLGLPPNQKILERARSLFARALETPGGLKIQTIHGFCESVLHRFAFEANLPAHFEILDDARARQFRHIAKQHTLRIALKKSSDDPSEDEPKGTIPTVSTALNALLEQFSETQIYSYLDHFQSKGFNPGSKTFDQYFNQLTDILGLEKDEEFSGQFEQLLNESLFDQNEKRELLNILKDGSKNEKKMAISLEASLLTDDPEEKCLNWLSLFLTKEGSAKKNLLVKATQEAHPRTFEKMIAEQERVVFLLPKVAAQKAFEVTLNLLTLLHPIMDQYNRLKLYHGLLDYNDLITYMGNLVTRQQMAAWVLYKLDGGIDHILVDEAQDTSPEQWKIIQTLAEESLSGEGARQEKRTLFAVGDEKQSIFSFQGADPYMFDYMRRYFERRIKQAIKRFDRVPLNFSFRSGPAILEAVDLVFEQPLAKKGLTQQNEPITHIAHRENIRSVVDIWPLVERTDEAVPKGWETPLNRVDSTHPRQVLAQKIADEIASWVTKDPDDEDYTKPGDILVLVRRRNSFVSSLIAALRARNVNVAGSDRLQLEDHIAVMDMMSLAKFVLLPEDDLSLAEVLKSPLVGFNEDQLFELAHNRTGTLFAALQEKVSLSKANDHGSRDAHHNALKNLQRWIRLGRNRRPFDFFTRVLSGDGARHRMIARLGPEAGDALEAFVDLTLEFEQANEPILAKFVTWMRGRHVEIKRDMEQGRNEVRIMTVHGAKGLEAPVVILPDTCDLPSRNQNPIVELEASSASEPMVDSWASVLAYSPGFYSVHPPAINKAKEITRTLEMEEYNRLLYVALTRAKERLYIGGYFSSKSNKLPDESWYALVKNALKPHCTVVKGAKGQDVLRFERGVVTSERPEIYEQTTNASEHETEIPDWLHKPLKHKPNNLNVVRPSGEMSLNSNNDRSKAVSFGNFVHLLLQKLPNFPAEQRKNLAEEMLAKFSSDLNANALNSAVSKVLAFMNNPVNKEYFGSNSRAEVKISGWILDSRSQEVFVSGQIDRLIVDGDTVTVLDFKSDSTVPNQIDNVSEAYIRQMAIYAALVRQVYPLHEIVCKFVWINNGTVMKVPDETLERAEIAEQA